MSLSNIGSNSVEEFFETILYGYGYSEMQEQLRGITGDIDDDVIQDAIQGATSILTAGLMSVVIRKQEDLISGLFDKTKIYISLLLGSSMLNGFKSRLRRFKGFKAFKRMGFFNSGLSDRIALAKMATDYNTSHMTAFNSKNTATSKVAQTMAYKEHTVNKENHKFSVGSEKAKAYQQTLMFKLFSKNFTATDQKIVKKILGDSSADMSDIDNLNEVADFMFIKDDSGNVTGLSEQFFSLLNGLGYVNK